MFVRVVIIFKQHCHAVQRDEATVILLSKILLYYETISKFRWVVKTAPALCRECNIGLAILPTSPVMAVHYDQGFLSTRSPNS